jgi:hypothetical protein
VIPSSLLAVVLYIGVLSIILFYCAAIYFALRDKTRFVLVVGGTGFLAGTSPLVLGTKIPFSWTCDNCLLGSFSAGPADIVLAESSTAYISLIGSLILLLSAYVLSTVYPEKATRRRRSNSGAPARKPAQKEPSASAESGSRINEN